MIAVSIVCRHSEFSENGRMCDYLNDLAMGLRAVKYRMASDSARSKYWHQPSTTKTLVSKYTINVMYAFVHSVVTMHTFRSSSIMLN
jgi:hypothetical protein